MAASLEGVLQCGRYFPSTVLSIFRNADVDQDGIVSGNEAVTFFASTGVDKKYLRSVWDIATDSQAGGLTPQHFSRALRLISLLQTGCEFKKEFIDKALHPQTGLQLPDPRLGSDYLKPPELPSRAVRAQHLTHAPNLIYKFTCACYLACTSNYKESSAPKLQRTVVCRGLVRFSKQMRRVLDALRSPPRRQHCPQHRNHALQLQARCHHAMAALQCGAFRLLAKLARDHWMHHWMLTACLHHQRPCALPAQRARSV
jgi:hypothetical protein